MAWLYVPDMPDWNSESNLPWAGDTELFVLLKGKPTQRPASWREWKRRVWIRRLSGTISRPSTAARGVEKWILSLGATRASRSALPASVVVQTIQDTCGPGFETLCETYSRNSVFSRTCGDTSQMDLIPCSENFTKSGTRQKQIKESLSMDCLARRKLGLHTGESDCSSWPTANVPLRGACPSERQRRSPDLNCTAVDWPTPRASAKENGGTKQAPSHKDGRHGKALAGVAGDWMTPNVPNGGRVPPAGTSETGKRPDGKKAQIGLENQAKDWNGQDPSPQDQEIPKDGQDSLKTTRHLNPLFVECIMGWPLLHTRI